MLTSFLNIEGSVSSDLSELVINLIDWLINFTAVLCVIMIIVSGFQYILTFGDKDKIKKANSSLIFAILGMILAFLAPNIIQFILETLLS
jgi:type IV secretory pathway VirB2 component (pilin)